MDFFKPIVELVQRVLHKCPKCGAEADFESCCPFAAEIYGMEERCGCCDECAHECAMDI